MAPPDLAIRAIGMVSSVGWGYEDSCASIRAGITRPSEITDYSVLDSKIQDLVPIVGYRIPVGASGFDTAGKWIAIGVAALNELHSKLGSGRQLPDEYWQSTLFVAVCPRLDPNRLQSVEPQDDSVVTQAFLGPILSQLGLPIPERNLRTHTTGQTGVFSALESAASELQAGNFKRAVILAVESYLDSLSLEWLDACGRLKTDDNPTGLIPSEAAVAICVDLGHSMPNTSALAVVEKVIIRDDVAEFFADGPRNGEAMSQVLSDLFSDYGEQAFRGDLLVDQNGEAWRAWEFACARARVGALKSDTWRMVMPATCIGETGAASGAIGIACAAASFERGYSSSNHAVVLSSSEFGPTAAARLSNAN